MIDSYTTQVTTVIIHMITHKKTLLSEWIKDVEFLQKLRGEVQNEMP